jgi:hypothetical protein
MFSSGHSHPILGVGSLGSGRWFSSGIPWSGVDLRLANAPPGLGDKVEPAVRSPWLLMTLEMTNMSVWWRTVDGSRGIAPFSIPPTLTTSRRYETP